MFTSFFHPLSTFPTLLTYGLLAPFILRLTVGMAIIYLGYERYKKPYKWVSILYVVFGALLVLGLYTQVSAIIAIAVTKFDFWTKKKSGGVSKEDFILYGMIVVILLSLLFTGPGFLAFDLGL